MGYIKKIVLYLVLLLIAVGPGYGQACCSSGAPTLGMFQSRTPSPGDAVVSVNYELNSLQDMVTQSRALNDNRRRRSTRSIFIETSLGLSKRFALSVLFSGVQQERVIVRSEAENISHSLWGVGDTVLLIRYLLFTGDVFSQRTIAIGSGVKTPTGKDNAELNGIQLPQDMQPGTGAWDSIFWLNFTQGFRPYPLQATFNAAYRVTGENPNGYQFGNELIANGLVQLSRGRDFTGAIGLKYRKLAPNEFRGRSIVNTGGKWMNGTISLGYNFSESVSVQVGGELPVLRQLNGTQLTTSYRVSLTTVIQFDIKQQE